MRIETIEDLKKVSSTLQVGCGMIKDLPNQVEFIANMPQDERQKELAEFRNWIDQFVPGLLAIADLCEQLAEGRSTRN